MSVGGPLTGGKVVVGGQVDCVSPGRCVEHGAGGAPHVDVAGAVPWLQRGSQSRFVSRPGDADAHESRRQSVALTATPERTDGVAVPQDGGGQGLVGLATPAAGAAAEAQPIGLGPHPSTEPPVVAGLGHEVPVTDGVTDGVPVGVGVPVGDVVTLLCGPGSGSGCGGGGVVVDGPLEPVPPPPGGLVWVVVVPLDGVLPEVPEPLEEPEPPGEPVPVPVPVPAEAPPPEEPAVPPVAVPVPVPEPPLGVPVPVEAPAPVAAPVPAVPAEVPVEPAAAPAGVDVPESAGTTELFPVTECATRAESAATASPARTGAPSPAATPAPTQRSTTPRKTAGTTPRRDRGRIRQAVRWPVISAPPRVRPAARPRPARQPDRLNRVMRACGW